VPGTQEASRGLSKATDADGMTGHFFPPGGQPFIANIHTNDLPEPCHARIGKQKSCYLGFGYLGGSLWLDTFCVFHGVLPLRLG
jgi:hypothetical protein